MKEVRVSITTEYIKLDQLLKFAGIAMSGAEAKEMVLDGMVYIDGEPCGMRGRKMRSGDCAEVRLDDETVAVRID